MYILLPHGYQVLWAKYQCFKAVIVLKNSGDRSCHQSFAQANNVTDNYSVALIEMMRCNFDSSCLEVPQLILQVTG
ncbi:hypothetical protein ES703_118656 [subsurface metagenome]